MLSHSLQLNKESFGAPSYRIAASSPDLLLRHKTYVKARYGGGVTPNQSSSWQLWQVTVVPWLEAPHALQSFNESVAGDDQSEFVAMNVCALVGGVIGAAATVALRVAALRRGEASTLRSCTVSHATFTTTQWLHGSATKAS